MIGIEKAGHSGTLDPGVSGLLPIGLGHATKALSLLLLFPKEYVAVMRIHSSVPREEVDRVVGGVHGRDFPEASAAVLGEAPGQDQADLRDGGP